MQAGMQVADRLSKGDVALVEETPGTGISLAIHIDRFIRN